MANLRDETLQQFREPLIALQKVVGEIAIRLPTPEDLIILKAVAHRPKDLLDIRTLIETYPNLDIPRIRRWVKEFGKALDKPELWKDIAPWFRSGQ